MTQQSNATTTPPQKNLRPGPSPINRIKTLVLSPHTSSLASFVHATYLHTTSCPILLLPWGTNRNANPSPVITHCPLFAPPPLSIGDDTESMRIERSGGLVISLFNTSNRRDIKFVNVSKLILYTFSLLITDGVGGVTSIRTLAWPHTRRSAAFNGTVHPS